MTTMEGVDATQLPNHSPGQLASAIWAGAQETLTHKKTEVKSFENDFNAC